MRFRLFAITCAVTLALAFAPVARSAPDLIIVNAHIFTADESQPAAEALAVENGRFSAVGASTQVRRLAVSGTRVIDAGGRLVTPGLFEQHFHVDAPPPGRFVPLPNIPFPGPTADETLAGIGRAAAAGPGWLWAIASYSHLEDPRNWRDALDAVAPNNPVVLQGCCGHLMILNSRALEALGITDNVENPIGGSWRRDSAGRLNGIVEEFATILVWQRLAQFDPTGAAAGARYKQVAGTYVRWGVTSVSQMATDAPVTQVRAGLIRAQVPIRWNVYAFGQTLTSIDDGWEEVNQEHGPWPARTRLAGAKWILDGTPIERNAFMREDYADRAGVRGRSNYSDSQLREILIGALASSHQVALHAVGDAECERLVQMMEALAPAERWRRIRVRVEHGDGFSGPLLARAAALGIVIIQNPIHLNGSLLQERLGARRDAFGLLRGIESAHVPLALASDAISGDKTANPFLQIMFATTRPNRPDEALTRERALLAYTKGAAYASRDESHLGQIRRGMDADVAILSQDVLSVPADALPATVSLLTLVGGHVVYAAAPFVK
jgi:predicted amidohydrolase YtcJ